MVIGICTKCKQLKEVRQHHFKGYNTDETAPYCQSCDANAHIKAIKDGRCLFSVKERRKLSTNSSVRRTRKTIVVGRETISPYVSLTEHIQYNLNTGHIYCETFFQANGAKKLWYEDI